jgi:hypothetical protein
MLPEHGGYVVESRNRAKGFGEVYSPSSDGALGLGRIWTSLAKHCVEDSLHNDSEPK